MKSNLVVLENPTAIRPYLAAVFDSTADLVRYRARLPELLGADCTVRDLPFGGFPLYILETAGFEFFPDLSSLWKAIQNLGIPDAPDEESGTVYKLSSPFAAEPPGTDEMGRLDHHHLHADLLSDISFEGERGLPGLFEEEGP